MQQLAHTDQKDIFTVKDRFLKLPVSLRFLIALLFLAPVVNFLLLSIQYGRVLFRNPRLFIEAMTLPGVILVSLAPIVAIGLWKLQKWAWYGYLVVFSLLIPLSGLLLWESASGVKKNGFDLLLIPAFLGNIGHLVFFYMLMRRKVRIPFLTNFPRDFRLADRVPLRLPCEVSAASVPRVFGMTGDISESGVSIDFAEGWEPLEEIQPGDKIDFRLADIEAVFTGVVQRTRIADGKMSLGVSLDEENQTQAGLIRNLIEERYVPRFAMALPVRWLSADTAHDSNTGITVNLSRRGAYIATQSELPPPGTSLVFQIQYSFLNKTGWVSYPGRTVWLKSEASISSVVDSFANDKPRGFGVRFDSPWWQYKRSRFFYFLFYYLKVRFQEPSR